jgi:ComEC/Rec2-related protein
MPVKLFKARVRALLLFFIDYKAILYCFTLISLLVGVNNFLEVAIHEGEEIRFETFFLFFLPTIIFGICLAVSYALFLHVQILGTFLKILSLSTLLVTCLGIFKFNQIQKEIQNIQGFTSKTVWITGVVESQNSESRYLLKVEGGQVGDVLIQLDGRSDIHVGQRCKMRGTVVEPSSFDEFDYKKYLFRKGIYAILQVKEYVCTDGGSIPLELRYKLERVVEKAVPEPEASLLIGIMFGSKRIFLDSFNDGLNSSGVSHIVAASGYNVALVANGIDILTRKYKGKAVIFLKILGIWLFCIFSGLSSSLIRAATMTSLYLFALLLGREVNKVVSLLFCVTLLLLLDSFLIYDVGFLFSFLSSLGLILFTKCFESIKSTFLKDSVLPTVVCILFTLPISILFFGKVSAISLLSNIVVVPIINSTIFWGLGATFINLLVSLKSIYIFPYIQLNIFKNFIILISTVDMIEVGINKVLLAVFVYTSLLIYSLMKYPVSLSNWYLKEGSK